MNPENNPRRLPLIVAGLIVIAVVGWVGWQYAVSQMLNQARDAINAGNFELAREKASNAARLNPWSARAEAYLGRAELGEVDNSPGKEYYPYANYTTAAPHYDKAIAIGLHRENPEQRRQILEQAGYTYWRNEDFDKAVSTFAKIISEFPGNAFWARYFVAVDYFERQNRPQEALEILLAIDSQSKTTFEEQSLYLPYLLMARLFSYFDNIANAKEYANRVITLSADPRAFEVQIAHGLLALQAAKEDDIDTAEAAVEKAVAAGGSLEAFECTRASAHFIVGNYQRAIDIATPPVTEPISPSRAPCLQVLGDAYLASNDPDEAKQYFQRFIALNNSVERKNVFLMQDLQRINQQLGQL